MKNLNKGLVALLAVLIASPLCAIQIEDGHGTGSRVKVDKDGKVFTLAVTEEEFEFVSEQKGLAFSWSNVPYVSAVGDSILCVQSDSDLEFYITDVNMASANDVAFKIHIPSSEITPIGTAVTGINQNRKSGNVAETTAKADETANTLGDVVEQGILLASTTYRVDLHSGLILGRTDNICVDFLDASDAAYVTIQGYFKESLGN